MSRMAQNATENKRDIIPVYKKLTLTVQEAAEYSNIGINKLYEITNDPRCTFILKIGTKKLVKRQQFEDYIAKRQEL